MRLKSTWETFVKFVTISGTQTLASSGVTHSSPKIKPTASPVGVLHPCDIPNEPSIGLYISGMEGSEGFAGCAESEIVVGASAIFTVEEVLDPVPTTLKQISKAVAPSAKVVGVDPV